MGVYSSRAFGVELDNRMANVDLTQVKCNFVVSPGGSGGTLNSMIGQNIDRANTLGVPFIMTWQMDPNPYLGIAGNSFPAPADDTHIKMMDRAIYIGGTPAGIKRKISGIVLDIRNNTTYNNQQVTQSNLKNMAQYLFNTIWSRYKIPIYIEASQALLDSYKNGSPELSQFLSTCDGICSWKSATPGAALSMASWSSFPIPGDTYKPEYIANAPLVYFSKYAATVYDFPGITDSSNQPVTVGLWMYKSTAANLNSDLNYTGPVTPVTPVTPTTPTGTPTLTDVYTLLQSLQTQITTINTNVATIRTHFN